MMIQQLFLVATIILVLLQCSSFSMTNAMPSDEKEETTSELSRFWKQRNLANNNLINPEKKENQNIINVDNFGANADGSNDANAFLEAWKKACNTPQSVLLVPANKTYVLNPTRFLGPCQPGFCNAGKLYE
ncbi:hypothetical protein Leryth_013214 [Lithospermum erythrorhizon]|nr:hypothetical protein Leryth_013214 [Lithospermum erythrorhizon]